MLKDSDIKKINKVCIAENTKIEGISETSRRILGAGYDKSISDVVKEEYRNIIADRNNTYDNYYSGHYQHLAATMNVIGFYASLPFYLSILSVNMLGTKFKTSISKLREDKYLSDLVSSGVIDEKDIPKFLEKISSLDSYFRTRDIGEELIEEYYSEEKSSMKH